ncbi:MAG: wax ester/triacylglycerol synthase family O-acyltransferase [Pseudomonadota bacterium]
MATHEMSPVDAAWFHMDGPANPAIVNALITTTRPLPFARVKAVFKDRLLRFERFRQRVVEAGLGLGTPLWEDIADFDLDLHLHHRAVPAPGHEAALRALVDDLVSAPLPHGQALWQAYVLESPAGGGALLLRYHHCIGDGLAMMTVARTLFDTSAQVKKLPPPETAPAAPHGEDLLGAAFEALAHPQQLAEAATRLAEGARVLLADLLKPGDPPSPFKGDFGQQQRVAWSAPIPIDDVKAIAWPFNAKVNDVLVAAVAGALRSYLARRGIDLRQAQLRAMVPVNLRPPERALALGNEFGLVILDLPVGTANAMQRVAQTKANMDALKRSPEPVAMQWLLDLFGRGPKPLQDLAQCVFGSKASVVLTNVAGPRRKLYLAGAPVQRMLFWVPHPGDGLGMGLSLMSYDGQVVLGVIGDARLVPDPERITAAFETEFARLKGRVAAAQARRERLQRHTSGHRVA